MIAATMLRMHAAQTTLQREGLQHVMQFGTGSIARLFRQEPPAPHEIERAIDLIEDELMLVPAALRGPGGLASNDGRLGAWAVEGAMAVEAVEALFQRVASASLGLPAAMHGRPSGRESAAALLILREVMHHLGYGTLSVRAALP